jgi:hypothetical protein
MGENMGRQAKKYPQVRSKLQWFFEQTAAEGVRSLAPEPDRPETPRWLVGEKAMARKNDVAMIGGVLRQLVSPGGLPGPHCRLRITPRMLDHLTAEFTDRIYAIETLYGKAKRKQDQVRNIDSYRKVVNRALARVDAAFHIVGILGNPPRKQRDDRIRRNAWGYLSGENR